MASIASSDTLQTVNVDDLLNDAYRKVTKIWKVVGLSENQQQSIIHKFEQELETRILKFVSEESMIRKQYEDEIKETILECQSIIDEMGLDEHPPAAEGDNLTSTLSNVRDNLERLRCTRKKVTDVIDEKLIDLHTCYSKMGSEIDESYKETGAATQQRLEDVSLKLTEMLNVIEMREKAVESEKEKICYLLTELNVVNTTEFDKSLIDNSYKSLGVSDAILCAFTSRLQELQEIKVQRTNEIKIACLRLAELWEIIGVESSERNSFLQNHTGLSGEVVRACETEVQRLELSLNENAAALILRSREKIFAALERLFKNKQDYPLLGVTESEFSVDLLHKHLALEKSLDEKIEHLRPILRDISRRESVLMDKLKYDQQMKDSSRLTARGRGAAARLREEERIRKKIKALPKLSTKLKENIKEWEMTNSPVLFKGDRYLNKILEYEKELQAKRSQKSKYKR